jgi:probable rRNA maturation factor
MKSACGADPAGLDGLAMEIAAMNPAPKRAQAAPTVDIVVNSPLWDTVPDAEAIVRRAVAAAAAAVSTPGGELAIVLTDDSSIRVLNRDWRGKDEATNVLSFPMPATNTDDDATMLLGDIVIAYETTTREAIAEAKPFGHHLAHLAVHGFLHLMGYDHETDREADVMENLEAVVLARLDVPNPYAASDASS